MRHFENRFNYGSWRWIRIFNFKIISLALVRKGSFLIYKSGPSFFSGTRTCDKKTIKRSFGDKFWPKESVFLGSIPFSSKRPNWIILKFRNLNLCELWWNLYWKCLGLFLKLKISMNWIPSTPSTRPFPSSPLPSYHVIILSSSEKQSRSKMTRDRRKSHMIINTTINKIISIIIIIQYHNIMIMWRAEQIKDDPR